MTAILPDFGLFYAAVPKIACTSIKHAFIELENDRTFQRYKANGRMRNIHHLYPTRPFDKIPQGKVKDFRKLALIRDPVERFVSAYSNRVQHHKELSWWKVGKDLERLGLAPDPGFEEYLDYFDKYKEASGDIYHHTLPMSFFLGEDAGFYDHLYQVREMDAFSADVSELCQKPFTVGRHQTGGTKIPLSDLSNAQIQKIRDMFVVDYEAFGRVLDAC